MPCLIGCIALVAPRFLIVILAIFTRYLHDAYDTWIWPLLGALFAPYTMLAYAWAMNAHGAIEGWWLVVIIFAVLLDLASHGQSSRKAKRRRR
jgi:TRAP-type C4-dicarboxylate transport system permease small subunit